MEMEADLQTESESGFVLECLLNGQPLQLEVAADRRLVDILRDDLQLTGTKLSCGIGRCGACMVLLDGKPVNSCLLMAYQCTGREIATIEHLSAGPLHPIQKALLAEGGMQCGYCTPGMVVSLVGLLEANPSPTREEAQAALCGNLCRCTGYAGIFRAIELLKPSPGAVSEES